MILAALLALSGSAVAGEHAEHAARADRGALSVPAASPRVNPPPGPEPGDRPDVTVYGYLAYWADDLDTVRWDHLTHVALFTAHAEPDGRLTDTSKWGDVGAALTRAREHDVHVHLTVANFDTGELRTLLGSETARNALIEALATAVEETGADGVNVDFEGMPAGRRAEMVTFTRDLAARVPEVVLATPAVDWSDAWAYGELTDHADLFIMGYGYHWSGSTYAGPVDPLFGGDPWAAYSLDWTLDDYVANGADPERVILGLPLYGYSWTTATDGVPAAAEGRGEVVFYAEGTELIATHGRREDPVSRTPWIWDGSRQAWFSDAESVGVRAEHTVASGMGGIGFWALNYEGGDDALWEAVWDATDLDEDPDTDVPDTDEPDDTDLPGDPRWVADAGDPFLAYVGETVQLSAEWSSGPDAPVYRWTQVSGPRVLLSDATAMDPVFRIEEGGVHAFEVVVGDGQDFSAPATSYVIAVDTEVAGGGCGCATSAPPVGVWAIPLVGLILLRRRGEGHSSQG